RNGYWRQLRLLQQRTRRLARGAIVVPATERQRVRLLPGRAARRHLRQLRLQNTPTGIGCPFRSGLPTRISQAAIILRAAPDPCTFAAPARQLNAAETISAALGQVKRGRHAPSAQRTGAP